MKKLVTKMFIFAAVAIALCFALPSVAFASSAPKISLSGSVSGKNVTVTVRIDGNTGITTANFRLDYDRSVLKFERYEQGSALTGLTLTTTGKEVETSEFRFLYDSADGVCDKSNGTMLVLTFSVIGDGDCRVTLSYKKNADVIALKNGKQTFVNPLVQSAGIRRGDGGSVSVVTIPSEHEPVDWLNVAIVSASVVIAVSLVLLLVVIFCKKR